MMDTSMLSATDLLAQQQVLETFKGLAPLLGSVQLSPNPREPKRSKHQHEDPPMQVPQSQVVAQTPQLQQLTTLVQQLAQLVLRHDRDLNQSRRADSFVLFFNRDPKGGLQNLLTATTSWQEQRKASTIPMTTLRQHLTQCLFQDLMVKVLKISEAKQEDQLFQASVQSQLIDAEGNWPFLEWDPKAKQLMTSTKTPISMTLMTQHVKELVEMFKNPDLVMAFRSLQTTSEAPICPWRLQLCPRADREWELLNRMSRNSVWTLLGTMLKPHALTQCGLADTIQKSLGHQPRKGKGKGKHKLPHQQMAQK